MRIFIGIKATNKLQEQIINWQEKHISLPVRFIKPDSLHLTLIPPWYERNINRLAKYLKNFRSPIPPFVIYFNKILYAPLPQPRLIWAEGNTPKELVILRNELVKHLGEKKVPLRGEKRPFKSHVTVARFKPEIFWSIKGHGIEKRVDWSMDSNEITLFESKLSPNGAQYFEIEKIKLEV